MKYKPKTIGLNTTLALAKYTNHSKNQLPFITFLSFNTKPGRSNKLMKTLYTLSKNRQFKVTRRVSWRQ